MTWIITISKYVRDEDRGIRNELKVFLIMELRIKNSSGVIVRSDPRSLQLDEAILPSFILGYAICHTAANAWFK
jgi:hypothetical protein